MNPLHFEILQQAVMSSPRVVLEVNLVGMHRNDSALCQTSQNISALNSIPPENDGQGKTWMSCQIYSLLTPAAGLIVL